MECLEFAPIRLKEGSSPSDFFVGGHGPFRVLGMPIATIAGIGWLLGGLWRLLATRSLPQRPPLWPALLVIFVMQAYIIAGIFWLSVIVRK